MGEMLTVGMVAHRLGLSTQRIRQLADGGVLAFHATPLGRLFELAVVEAYEAHRRPQSRSFELAGAIA